MEEKLRGVGPERSTTLVLQELAQDRRKEVRSLAVRSLAAVGKFEPLLNTLDETEQRTAWPEHVETLRAAVARGPETSAQVRKALTDLRGDKEADLFRMYWGYSEEQLSAGDGDKLVDYLEHPDLDFRVLSYWNLKNITGKSLNYRPEYPEAKRRQGVQQFRLLANKGQITYPKKPEPKAGKQPRPEPEAPVDPPAEKAAPPAPGE